MLLERERYFLGHGYSGYRMILEHKCYYGLGMDALVIGCTPNMKVIDYPAPRQANPHSAPSRKAN